MNLRIEQTHAGIKQMHHGIEQIQLGNEQTLNLGTLCLRTKWNTSFFDVNFVTDNKIPGQKSVPAFQFYFINVFDVDVFVIFQHQYFRIEDFVLMQYFTAFQNHFHQLITHSGFRLVNQYVNKTIRQF